jgi:nucleoside-diphosphate-sugar epimerase
MNTSVSILGCGWLGLPLGAFLAGKGFRVKGSTTRTEKLAELKQAGIQPYVVAFSPHPPVDQLDYLPEFLQSDILVIAIPPQTSRQGDDYHPLQMLHLSEQLKLSPVNHIIYISSTSIYPDENREVRESDALTSENAGNHAIRRAEELVSGLHRNATILRCGGLMGYDRIPGKYVAGKQVNTGDIPVNFVHRDDVIRIIYEVMRQEKWNEVFNVVAPEHPVRKEIYARNAREFGYQLPELVEGETPAHKVVNGEKLIKELNYQYIFANPLDFTYEARQPNRNS